MRFAELSTLAVTIDPERAPDLRARYAAWGGGHEDAAALATAVVTGYPAFGALADARPQAFFDLCREGWRKRRDRVTILDRLTRAIGDFSDVAHVRSQLRLAVQYEKLRIATRELLPRWLDGADVDVTSREIADLAEAAIEVALTEARAHVEERFGPPRTRGGALSTFVVLGMGKLGGRELNAGSDVDLLFFYDTDEGESAARRRHRRTADLAPALVPRRAAPDRDAGHVDCRRRGLARRPAPSARGLDRCARELAARGRALL